MILRLLFCAWLLLPVQVFAADFEGIMQACDVNGGTLVYDMERDAYYKRGIDEDLRTLPASTFKILNSLIALDAGVADANTIFQWDGVERDISEWNRDADMKWAFRYSLVWVYELIARDLGMPVYRRYLDWVGYGNGKIDSGKDENFWVYGDFGVSPKEQIEMLVDLYRDKLPFSKSSMDTVKDFMKSEYDGKGVLRAKTGWTKKDGWHIGWYVGYVERVEKAPLFFATRIFKDETKGRGDFSACRKTITFQAMNEHEGAM